jgi:Sec-independent protein translocase protein TatA
MLGTLRPIEVILILLVLGLLFGAKRLPDTARRHLPDPSAVIM